MIRVGHTIKKLFSAFGRSQRGNVAMMTGVALPILLMVSAGAIDLHNMARVKSELQDALDAASLAAARSPYAKQADIQRVGMDALRANMPGYFQGNPGDIGTFTITGKDQVTATATVQVKTIVANIFLPPYGKLFDDYMPMSASSEVLRASRNVEVALALDVTGSMQTPQNFMPALIDAAKELVGIVVQGDQSIYTTKVALIPYAAGVNMGSELKATALRGALTGDRSFTAASRLEASKRVSSVNNSAKEFTLSGHGFEDGDVVYMTGFSSNAGINEKTFAVSVVDASRFKLRNVSVGNLGTTRGYVRKCIVRTCDMVVTATGHGLETGERVLLSGASSGVGINTSTQNGYDNRGNLISMPSTVVTRIDNNRFSVPSNASITQSWTGTGKLRCGADRCGIRLFENMRGNSWRLDSTTCVSERPRGNSAPSDAPVGSSNYLGRVYINNTCPESEFVPLTNSLDDLKEAIEDLEAGGSTAGQVGVEMAWYSISPNFGAINGVSPLPFNTQETIKAVVLMTDGEFNIPFCQGVIAKDALSDGSGSNDDKINCNATNGNAFQQAYQTCLAMKSQGIVVYSVAFNLKNKVVSGSVDTAYEVMRFCATDPDANFFVADSGVNLKEAFKAIGRDITRLRIAR